MNPLNSKLKSTRKLMLELVRYSKKYGLIQHYFEAKGVNSGMLLRIEKISVKNI